MKVDTEFDSEFDYEYVGSHANKELVMCHRPDRTLIEAEYVLPESKFRHLDYTKVLRHLLRVNFPDIDNTDSEISIQYDVQSSSE